jgi:hypothetical protein
MKINEMELGPRQKIIAPFCLVFGPSARRNMAPLFFAENLTLFKGVTPLTSISRLLIGDEAEDNLLSEAIS